MVALFDTAGRVDLELESFQTIPAGDHHSLLRVAGRWVLAPGVNAPTPTLVAQRGARRDRFSALPGAGHDFADDWSAGFAVPLDVVLDARVRFWIEAEGPRYPLPAPVERELFEGARPQVVVRNGRPHLLVAAGLMAVALTPLAQPASAAAQELAPTGPTAVEPAATVAADTATPAPEAAEPTGPVGDPAVAAPTTTGPVAVAPAPAEQPAVEVEAVEPTRKHKRKRRGKAEAERPKATKKKKHHKHPKHKQRKHASRRKAAPTRTATPTVAHYDPTPHVTPAPSPFQQSYAVPPFLLPIYQAAATEYNLPWEVLAAINEVETNFGRNLNVSSAGAQGWMQFMPATWATYGVDANLDGHKDAANPADAIFAAARYLRAAGGEADIRRAIFAYNHADWYVDEVMAKAEALQKLPAGAVASLTGLAIGRFPVPGPHVTYDHAVDGWVGTGDVTTPDGARVTGPVGREVVVPTTVRVLYLGRSANGVFAVLEDAYGNRFTYGHLAHLVRHYARVVRQRPTTDEVDHQLRLDRGVERVAYKPSPRLARSTWPAGKERLYANPALHAAAPVSVVAKAAHRLGVRQAEVVMARLRPGAVVPAGTVIGRLGGALTSHGHAHVLVRIRPAGGRAHQIDPAPILEAWRLAARGAMGPTSAKTKDGEPLSLGRSMLLSDRQLARRVLLDDRVQLTHAGRDDVRSGQIDRRVLVSLEAMADAGLHPSVSALRSGTTTDDVRTLGRGMEIVAINGERLGAVRSQTSTASQALRLLRSLPGPLAPRHAQLTADIADGPAVAIAASTSTAQGRLKVSYPRRPHASAAISRAVNAMLRGGSPIIAGAQGAGAPDVSKAPKAVKRVVSGADAIAGLPYVWGGGHGSWDASGYDCSGSVSYALHAAGLLDAPLTSGELADWGAAGPGEWITIYANPTHVIMEINGQFYGTSGFGHPETGGGPGWFSVTPSTEYLAGFTVRHPEGL